MKKGVKRSDFPGLQLDSVAQVEPNPIFVLLCCQCRDVFSCLQMFVMRIKPKASHMVVKYS